MNHSHSNGSELPQAATAPTVVTAPLHVQDPVTGRIIASIEVLNGLPCLRLFNPAGQVVFEAGAVEDWHDGYAHVLNRDGQPTVILNAHAIGGSLSVLAAGEFEDSPVVTIRADQSGAGEVELAQANQPGMVRLGF